jgi:glyoxylase-like metal-dependent hydrolase (beta-lactamase superfamily II)
MPIVHTWFVIALAALALWAQAPQEGDSRGKAGDGKANAKGGRGARGGGETKALAPPPDPQVLRIVRPNLYLITGEGGNSVFRVTPDGVILVDTKLAKAGNYERLTELIRGITPQPVKWVLNTHGHPDHAGNNDRFPALPAAPESVARLVRLPEAHTANDSAILFPADRVVAAGDVITSKGAPVFDQAAGGSLGGMARAVDAILALDWDVAVPGHGEPMTRAQVQAFRSQIQAAMSAN